MAPLRNLRHENLCRLAVEGLKHNWTQIEIYQRAGYRAEGKAAEACASRLLGSAKIQDRIAELRAPAIRKSQVSLASLLAELQATVEAARAEKQFSAVNGSLALIAKLTGLLVEKASIEISGPYDGCTDIPSAVAKWLDRNGDNVDEALALIDEMRAEVERQAADRAVLVN